MKNSRWLSLIVLCTGFLLIVVDMTIVNVALPSIQKDLGFSQSGLAWVVNAYLIAFGGLLLLAGRVGDLAGRKRVYLAGLVIFTAASVLCGLSFAQPMLIAARFVQGVGGAVSSAVILAMIVTLFPVPLAQRHRRQPRPGLDVHRLPRLLLPGLARPRARAGLRPHGDRAGVPARRRRDGAVLGPLLGAADRAFWPDGGAGRRPGGRAGRPGGDRRRPRALRLLRAPARADGAARAGRRALLSGADDDRDGRRLAGGRWTRLGPPEHHGRGGGRVRAGGAGDHRRRSHPRHGQPGRGLDGGAVGRLPPGVDGLRGIVSADPGRGGRSAAGQDH